MGGHGGLNILGHKSWNVYGKKQRKRVRDDESKQEQEQQRKREEEARRASAARLRTLRSRARGSPSPESSEADVRGQGLAPARNERVRFRVSEDGEKAMPRAAAHAHSAPQAHVDLFSVETVASPSKKRPKKAKNEEDLRALRRVHPTIFFSEAGQAAASPWYAKRKRAAESDTNTRAIVVGADKASRELIEKSAWGRGRTIERERRALLDGHSKRWNDPLTVVQHTLGKSELRYLANRVGVRSEWKCPSCSSANFAKKRRCGRCGARRPEHAKPDAAPPVPRRFRDGDWVCPRPDCARHNFKSNETCFKCGTTRAERVNVFEAKPERNHCREELGRGASADNTTSGASVKTAVEKKDKKKKRKKKKSRKKEKKRKKRKKETQAIEDDLRQERLARERAERAKAAALLGVPAWATRDRKSLT